ncbi:MAG: M28 family metallopeptidase [Kofleriaceae bacterium]
MRRISGLGIAAVVLVATAATALADAAKPTSCKDDEPFDQATFETKVAFLASKELDGRAPGSTGDAAARKMIAERFECLGLSKAFGASYEQAFVANTKTTANVVGYIAGSDATVGSEIVLVAAHHDHLGKGYLGANDNASGIVAMLAVAQSIVQREEKPKRTIVFAAFGAEETGMHGSYFYEAHAPETLPADRIVQVINLDMVGSHASRGYVAALGSFAKVAATPILKKLLPSYPKLDVAMGGKARGSDFEPFCKKGTPYVFFWTPDRRCYHGRCDTADKLDYPRMVDIAKLATDLTAAIADTEVDLVEAKATRGCFGTRR